MAQQDESRQYFQSDFGGVGLLQTPTARMNDLGEFSFTYDETDPYRHYAFSLQPLDWFELGLRYTKVDGRPFRASNGELDYLDKGIDFKLSLVDESQWVPKIAVGLRDVGGTSLFGSEYVVANKRWFDFDFSLGLGWGYLGSRGDIGNPLGVLGERYDERQDQDKRGGGEFNLKDVFTGRAAIFGGIQYQTPYKPLTLQLEYEGNDYQNEPFDNQEQDSPINIGARYRVNDNLTLSAAWERGNTAMLGLTLSVNLAKLSQPKSDRPPVPVRPAPESVDKQDINWRGVAGTLARNAGISVTAIEREGDALIVEGSSERYRSLAEAELRGNRILHNVAEQDITSFRYRWTRRGFYLREDSLPRAPLPDHPLFFEPGSPFADLDYRKGIVSKPHATSKSSKTGRTQTLYSSFNSRFSWNLSPGINYNYGGPDGLLYEIYARLDTELKTDENGWFSGTLGYGLFDNLENFDYVGPSQLPRVRTYVVNYIDQTDLGIYNLQYTRTARLADNWFGMAYAGYLERMFAGGGGEILYRPFNSRIAFGIDANWVKQREFDTQFGLRDYSTWTGHATAYVDTGIKDVLAKFSVGRYLAKDVGATIDLSREFESGVRIGAFATMTDAGDKFGEGSFDKGIYLSMPLDVFYTTSTRERTGVLWRPLTRDGGQSLQRRYTLFGITQERDLGGYWQNFEDRP